MRPTVDDVRDLSRRSRRTHRWALLAVVAALAFVPAQLALQGIVAASWLALGSTMLGGALLLRFAFVAGEERGAYRRLFKELKEARRLALREDVRPPVARADEA